MMDVELLAALAAGNFELSLEGSTFPPVTSPPATLNQGPLRPPALQQPGPASHHPASTGRNQASPLDQQRQASRLTSNKEQPSKGKRAEDSRTGTAKHSRATAARNSQRETSQQQARLKRSCQQPSKELQPMAGRHIRQKRKCSNAIGPEYSTRRSSWLRSRTALA
jgi:hypothetical protein